MPDITFKKLGETSKKVNFRNMIIKDFELPDGNTHDFDVIDYRSGGAAIFGITKENKVVVARQFRPGLEKVMDELPGGTIDPDEDPLAAAAREFQEETGYQAGEIESMGTFTRDAYIDGTWHYFLARECKKVTEPDLGAHEFVEVVELAPEELLESATNAKMTDPAAVLLAMRKLGW